MVAAALVGGDGRILLQRRRQSGEHGGLWEFPGGKIDPGESPESALVREVAEELAIAIEPSKLEPVAFAIESEAPQIARAPYVVLLYRCLAWRGDPHCLAAEEIGWFRPGEFAGLAMPPLDVPLARALMEFSGMAQIVKDV